MSAAAGAADPVAEILDLGGADMRRRMALLEADLHAIAGAGGGRVADEATETIAAGGKRLRPLLVFIAGHGAGVQDPPLVRAAAAVELIHSATLVHDDVLDAAPQRRGRPTVFARAGRLQATATGDLLLSRAFSHLVANGEPEQLRVLSAASSALARGELVQREDAWRTDISTRRYLQRCELKTAALFEAACELGVLAGGGGEDLRAGLRAFGRRIGLAFQILDDILDLVGDSAATGKRPGADLLDGTVTLPLILAREEDAELAAIDLRAIVDPEPVCERVAATGGPRRARELALGYVTEAKLGLPALDRDRRRALELVADGVVARYS